MIIVLPTATGVLVGIDPRALITPKKSKGLPVTADDLHRFQAVKRYLDGVPKKSTEDNSNN